MDVRLRLPDDPDGGELKQLYDWLTRDREVSRGAYVSLRTADGPDDPYAPDEPSQLGLPDEHMGPVVDAVQAVLDHWDVLVSLGGAVLAWRRAQHSRSAVVVEWRDTKVVLPGGTSPEEAARFLRALREAGEAQEPQDTPPTGPDDSRPDDSRPEDERP